MVWSEIIALYFFEANKDVLELYVLYCNGGDREHGWSRLQMHYYDYSYDDALIIGSDYDYDR